MIFRLVKRLNSKGLSSHHPFIVALFSSNRQGSGAKDASKNEQTCSNPSHLHAKKDATGASLHQSHSFQHIYDSITRHQDPSSRLLLGYTCRSCSERSHHSISKIAYSTGIVIVTCPGCSNRHLIADHLGWFENVLQDKTKHHATIDKMLAERGESITTNFTIERSKGERESPLESDKSQPDTNVAELDDISIIPKKTGH